MKAFELLADPKNWKKEAGNVGNVPCCIVVAILNCHSSELLHPPYSASSRYKIARLAHKIGVDPNGISIGAWNDAPERTHEDVINVLKELDI